MWLGSFGKLLETLEISGNLWETFENFGKPWKQLEGAMGGNQGVGFHILTILMAGAQHPSPV